MNSPQTPHLKLIWDFGCSPISYSIDVLNLIFGSLLLPTVLMQRAMDYFHFEEMLTRVMRYIKDQMIADTQT